MYSSFVGMMMIFTCEESADISRSKPRWRFFSSSRMMPSGCRPVKIMRRIFSQFSPTPAVSTMASTPPMTAMYWPMYFFTEFEYMS